MIRCQACGTENPAGATHCTTCARRLDAETQDAVVERRAAHTATGIRWSMVLVTVVLIVIVAVLLILLVGHVL